VGFFLSQSARNRGMSLQSHWPASAGQVLGCCTSDTLHTASRLFFAVDTELELPAVVMSISLTQYPKEIVPVFCEKIFYIV
jgi:hypothetical protein